MPIENKEKPIATPQQQIEEAATSEIKKATKNAVRSRLAQGQGPISILRDLMGEVQRDSGINQQQINQGVESLASMRTAIPGSKEGLLGTLMGLTSGKFVSPFAERTQEVGIENAMKIMKNIVDIKKAPLEDKISRVDAMSKAVDYAKKTGNRELFNILTGNENPQGKTIDIDPMTGDKTELGFKQEAIAKAAGTEMGKQQAFEGKMMPKTRRFINQFSRSYKELSTKFPDIAKEGLEGKLSRFQGVISERLDELPETKALSIMIEPLANGMARDVEGGRVTDSDREIYAKAFANVLKNPGPTNMRLVSAQLGDLIDKGATKSVTEQLKMMSSENIPLFDGIINQVLMEYPELVESVYGKGAEVIDED